MTKNKLVSGKMKASTVQDLRTAVIVCSDWAKSAGTDQQTPAPSRADQNIEPSSYGLFESVWIRTLNRLEKTEKWDEIYRRSGILDNPNRDQHLEDLERRVAALELA